MQRYHICPYHAAIPQMTIDGQVVRFCQQCGRFQALREFSGTRKTCMRKLQMHNAQRKRKRAERYNLPVTHRTAYISTRIATRRATNSEALTDTPQVSSPAPSSVNPSSVMEVRKEEPNKTAADSVLLASAALSLSAGTPTEDIANIFDEVDLDDLFLDIKSTKFLTSDGSYQPLVPPAMVAQRPAITHVDIHPAILNQMQFARSLPQHLSLQTTNPLLFPASFQAQRAVITGAQWSPQLQQQLLQRFPQQMPQLVHPQNLYNHGYVL